MRYLVMVAMMGCGAPETVYVQTEDFTTLECIDITEKVLGCGELQAMECIVYTDDRRPLSYELIVRDTDGSLLYQWECSDWRCEDLDTELFVVCLEAAENPWRP